MYSSRTEVTGQITKQPLSNFEPQKPWQCKQVWGLRSDPSCLYKKRVTVDYKNTTLIDQNWQ